jgi:hypothetical protein
VEVEAIGNVRHKNLVRLLGYCVEGTQRSEYMFIFFFRFLYNIACYVSVILASRHHVHKKVIT